MAQYKFDAVRWLRSVAEIMSHRAGAGPAMTRENMLKCAEEMETLRSKIAALKTVLHSISLGSQNSMTTKEELGAEARRALAVLVGEE